MPERFAAEIKSRPPVLLIHGDQDDLIPVAGAVPCGTSGWPRSDVPVEWHISAGVGHGIDQEGLRHGGEFLTQRRSAAGQIELPCGA